VTSALPASVSHLQNEKLFGGVVMKTVHQSLWHTALLLVGRKYSISWSYLRCGLQFLF
jgi:hypothetical protein